MNEFAIYNPRVRLVVKTYLTNLCGLGDYTNSEFTDPLDKFHSGKLAD